MEAVCLVGLEVVVHQTQMQVLLLEMEFLDKAIRVE
jgi:hypothetical protein